MYASWRDLHARILPQHRVALVELVRRRDGRFYGDGRVGLLLRVVLGEFYIRSRLVHDAGDVAAHICSERLVVETFITLIVNSQGYSATSFSKTFAPSFSLSNRAMGSSWELSEMWRTGARRFVLWCVVRMLTSMLVARRRRKGAASVRRGGEFLQCRVRRRSDASSVRLGSAALARTYLCERMSVRDSVAGSKTAAGTLLAGRCTHACFC